MSRLSRLAPRDLDALSAYADGALAPAERRALEQRLGQDANLREALNELRATSALLRALPQVRPPRSFTLTPEMAGIRRGWLRGPFLQLATAVATLAFVVTVGVDVLGGMVPSGALRAAAPAQEMMMEAPAEVAAADALGAASEPSLAETEAAVDEAVGEDAAAAGAVGVLEAGATAAPVETQAAEKVLVEETAAVAAAPLEAPAATPTAAAQAEEYASREAPNVEGTVQVSPAPVEAPPAPMEAAAPTSVGECEACAPDLVLPTAAPIESPAAEALDAVEAPVTEERTVENVEPPSAEPVPSERVRGWPALRWLEIGLGAAALALGVLTLRARRRSR